MKILKYTAILLLICLNVLTAQEEKMRLAIMDLQPNNVSDPTARMVSDKFLFL